MQTTWTPETRAAAIAKELALIETRAVQMAVVDYGIAWRKTGATARFGVRGRTHVTAYRLTPVAFNAAWLAAKEA